MGLRQHRGGFRGQAAARSGRGAAGRRAAAGRSARRRCARRIYSGNKAGLRALHEALLQALAALGSFETAPKKAYVSLRRSKQFAMVGPATAKQIEIGLNCKTLPERPRLIEKPGGMCQASTRIEAEAQIDAELIGWLRRPRRCGLSRGGREAVVRSHYSRDMKTAVIPQVRVEPELRADLDAVLHPGETLTEFVEASVRRAIEFRRVQTDFAARCDASLAAYERSGVSRPAEAVLDKLEAKVAARLKQLSK